MKTTQQNNTVQAPSPQRVLLTRRQVAARIGVSTETVKRYARAGRLHPLIFSARNIRYDLLDVIELEKQAQEDGTTEADPLIAAAATT